jgi:hypothetical protein
MRQNRDDEYNEDWSRGSCQKVPRNLVTQPSIGLLSLGCDDLSPSLCLKARDTAREARPANGR